MTDTQKTNEEIVDEVCGKFGGVTLSREHLLKILDAACERRVEEAYREVNYLIATDKSGTFTPSNSQGAIHAATLMKERLI